MAPDTPGGAPRPGPVGKGPGYPSAAAPAHRPPSMAALASLLVTKVVT